MECKEELMIVPKRPFVLSTQVIIAVPVVAAIAIVLLYFLGLIILTLAFGLVLILLFGFVAQVFINTYMVLRKARDCEVCDKK